jgi:hypothetical protein
MIFLFLDTWINDTKKGFIKGIVRAREDLERNGLQRVFSDCAVNSGT